MCRVWGIFAGWRFAYPAYKTIGIMQCRPDKAQAAIRHL